MIHFLMIFKHCDSSTLIENHSKCPIWIFNFAIFHQFLSYQSEMSNNTVWPKATGFQKLAKSTIFGIFNELLSTQNINVDRFARNVECDFLDDFQTLCFFGILQMILTWLTRAK